MKITKKQLKQLIKEELKSALSESNGEVGDIDPSAEPRVEPAMSTGWKLDRILEILEKAPFAPPEKI